MHLPVYPLYSPPQKKLPAGPVPVSAPRSSAARLLTTACRMSSAYLRLSTRRYKTVSEQAHCRTLRAWQPVFASAGWGMEKIRQLTQCGTPSHLGGRTWAPAAAAPAPAPQAAAYFLPL